MSSDSPHCELCESMMFGGSVAGDDRYFCGCCIGCYRKVEAERDEWQRRAEKAEAELASRTRERDRAREWINECPRSSGEWERHSLLRCDALADEPEEVTP